MFNHFQWIMCRVLNNQKFYVWKESYHKTTFLWIDKTHYQITMFLEIIWMKNTVFKDLTKILFKIMAYINELIL